MQRWVYSKAWESLRPIQERSIPAILEGRRDVIISAPTAGGKTEAAFLPIVSRLATDETRGLGCLCISPLKALINDQHLRLEQLLEAAQLPAHRWHGDVSATAKRAVLKKPSGVLLITPESLEALFVLRGSTMPGLWSTLRYVVIDELHAFIGSERGRQLQSLLHRVELAAGRRVPRVGLSATLGDPSLGAYYLRHDDAAEVLQIKEDSEGTEVRLQLRGYVDRAPTPPGEEDGASTPAAEDESVDGGLRDVAAHLFRKLRGTNNLVFANSRRRVEALADQLRRTSERERVPNEFLPHHGSLSRELREDVEALLKNPSRAANVICTTTLELGIDIGNIESVAQVGVPPSVASLRQRLGRSGRRAGAAATMRAYVIEQEMTPQTTLRDALRTQLVQTIAMFDLYLVDRWCEPPDPLQLHLSTLVQQLLSLIAQHGGVHAAKAYDVLCRTGPFRRLSPQDFKEFLGELGRRELIQQTSSGEIVLGVPGERLVDHYTFFTAFTTPDEYRVETAGQVLGSLPITFPIYEDAFLIFAGRRWKVTHVDPQAKVLSVVPSPGGKPPEFDSHGIAVHARIRERMREVYGRSDVPSYLDTAARTLLAQARSTFAMLDLAKQVVLKDGNDVLVFPWTGDRIMGTLALWLSASGLAVEVDGTTLALLNCSMDKATTALAQLAATEPHPHELAKRAADLVREKYDHVLPERLLREQYVLRDLDVPGAAATLVDIARRLDSHAATT